MNITEGLERLLDKRPWLLPILLLIDERDAQLKAEEIGKLLGIRTRVVRRALWILKRHGILVNGKLPEEAKQWLASQKIWRRGRRFLWEHKGGFYIITVSRTRVKVRWIPRKVVRELHTYALNTKESIKPSRAPVETGLPTRLVVLGLRALWLMGILHRGKEGYVLSRENSQSQC